MRSLRTALILAAALSLVIGVSPARAGTTSTISGTVTDEASTAPLANICVEAESENQGWAAGTNTDESGTYSLRVDPDSYRVSFSDCGDGGYLREWYNNQPDYGHADAVVVGDSEDVTGIDAALARGGSISGVVTDDGGSPLAGMCASAVVNEWDWVGGGSTDEAGVYRIGGLPTGDFRVQFTDCSGPVWAAPMDKTDIRPVPPQWAGPRYVTEWYDDKPDFDHANTVSVVAGQDTPGINAALMLGGTISGVVTDSAGTPISGVCPTAWNAAADSPSGSWTWDDGTYRIGGLRPGDYKVRFNDCSGDRFYGEWYDNVRSESAAQVIKVESGQEVAAIDAVLDPRPIPDPAVTDLTVKPVPLRTDFGPLVSTGLQRRVVVEVSNLGTLGTATELEVWVTTNSDQSTASLGGDRVVLKPGETVRRAFDWNATGSFGDATVHAMLCPDWDINYSNNERTARAYAIVGGTGIGFQVAKVGRGGMWPGPGFCSPYPVPVYKDTSSP